MVDVAALLSGLTQDERDAAFTSLAFARSKRQTKETTTLQNHYWDAIGEALGLTGSRHQPLPSMIKTYGAAKFDESVADLEGFIDDSCGVLLRATQRQAVRVQVFKAFVKYLRRREHEATPRRLLEAGRERLSHGVDLAYPGYARAQMLHRIAPLARNVG